PKRIRMANRAVEVSLSENSVAALHTELLQQPQLHDFHEMWPERFNNKTNGVTPRRWLVASNPRLSDAISNKIGEGWMKNLDELKKLEAFADDAAFIDEVADIKSGNKLALSNWIQQEFRIPVDPDSLFDVQIKRIHEYKRQLLNLLHVIALYLRIKNNPKLEMAPRTFLFGGKAAPAYFTAKTIIKLINSVASVVNSDPQVNGHMRVLFLPNYRVSLAEKVFPASDLSEQISTAGKEASGTGNMKFALNGALTIGTLDGANIEIREEVGAENFFLFGLTAQEVADKLKAGYRPRDFYESDAELKAVLDLILSGFFEPSHPDEFKNLARDLLERDQYLLLADFRSYVECQNQVSLAFKDQKTWHKKAILNVARMGKFSSDRTIREYASEIWKTPGVPW
ncbi:MAG: glycogen/starch/alpha-glucan family phosphorylase, partial [Deltaproteobacteria bacterium]|nr:glycogen/starch/alpha-glucan family phosphorylase [Deltaproteobacteria bacterium]